MPPTAAVLAFAFAFVFAFALTFAFAFAFAFAFMLTFAFIFLRVAFITAAVFEAVFAFGFDVYAPILFYGIRRFLTCGSWGWFLAVITAVIILLID